MYTVQPSPDGPVVWDRDIFNHDTPAVPVMTLTSPSGGRLHVVEDDGQYVLLVQRGSVCLDTQWWPPEVIKAVAHMVETK